MHRVAYFFKFPFFDQGLEVIKIFILLGAGFWATSKLTRFSGDAKAANYPTPTITQKAGLPNTAKSSNSDASEKIWYGAYFLMSWHFGQAPFAFGLEHFKLFG